MLKEQLLEEDLRVIQREVALYAEIRGLHTLKHSVLSPEVFVLLEGVDAYQAHEDFKHVISEDQVYD